MGSFVFADGSRRTPEEYGYLAVRVGYQAATEQTDALFAPDVQSAKLGLAQAIQKVRFPSDIYICMLEVGVYLWHAAMQPDVDHALIQRVMKGVEDCIQEIRSPNGQPLEPEFKALLLNLARRFSIEIAKDVEEGSARSSNTFHQNALPSTELLLGVLMKGSSNEPSVIESWRKELATPSGLWLKHMIEDSTLASMQLLRKKLAVCYAP
jgi:hypothetical protein